MEKLIFLIAIVVISMIHSWWKKRNGESDEDSAPWPGQAPRRPPVAPPQNRPASSPQPKAASWEEELRRLLQGQEPAQPVPPPVVVQQQAPPPLPRATIPQPRPAPRPVTVSQSDPDMDTGWNRQAPSMLQSAQAFLHGSMPAAEVPRHMQQAHPHVATHQTLSLKKEASPEVRQAVALVRSRQSQRATILAGIILGPPKAMEG